ncbi:MAG: hypothetical protein WA215_11415 [Candidatus Cybelea sp.]
MALQLLAPSIVPLVNTDRAPNGRPDPTRRLTVLLGAGASLYAGSPSTDDLTSIVAGREISGAILRALRSRCETSAANFEDVLHVLEELDALLGTTRSRAPSMLRPLIEPSSILNGITIDSSLLRRERYELLEAIAAAFDGIDYDSAWHVLYRLLRPLLDDFDIDFFTLNYDQVVDVAVYGLSMLSGKKLLDGFGQVIDMENSRLFRADQYAHWDPNWGPVHLTLQHVHGSLLFAYYGSDRRMAHATRFELVRTESYEIARRTWREATEAAAAHDLDFEGVVPIVSGLRKMEKLNVQPYANYFAYLAHAVSASPYLMIIGYGAGDEHINYWLREYTAIHGEAARVVEITQSDDSSRFTMQRFGAYDLQWTAVPGNNDAFTSHSGVPCLTITGGITSGRSFEGRLDGLIRARYEGTLD